MRPLACSPVVRTIKCSSDIEVLLGSVGTDDEGEFVAVVVLLSSVGEATAAYVVQSQGRAWTGSPSTKRLEFGAVRFAMNKPLTRGSCHLNGSRNSSRFASPLGSLSSISA